jgi:hypothetical protein
MFDFSFIPPGISLVTIAFQFYLATLVIAAPGIMNLYVGYLKTKDLEFKLAKGWLKIMSKKNDDVNKMKYFGFGINYYNKYLRRKLKIDLNKALLFSQIIRKSIEDRNKILNSVLCTFEDNNNDKLKPIANLSSIFPDKEPFLIKESLAQKIIDIGGFIAAAIPVVITILQIATILPKSQ